jgi:nucleoside-triphosphatase
MASVFLLTGRPGTGKTTIIRETLSAINLTKGGFYTQEIKEGGVRRGFKIVNINGMESVLSHIDFPKLHRVGKYGVDLDNFERVGVASIEKSIDDCELIVIDEIGRMELLSSRFKEAVLKAIESNKYILGTIMQGPDAFADRIKKLPSVRLIMVTIANRGLIMKTLPEDLKEIINEDFSKATGQDR